METYKEISFAEAMRMAENGETEKLYVKFKGALEPSKVMNFSIRSMLKDKWFKKTTECDHTETLKTKTYGDVLISERCIVCDKEKIKDVITDDDPIKPEVSS
ncbi:hypothetical protein EP56_02180 [Listeriaceae bacterium FSL A5-0209]|nr:hypothetical protein EP56_02180 [Listeriaceae bacterium FSL A5-0209]